MPLEWSHIDAVIGSMRKDPARPFKTCVTAAACGIASATFIEQFRNQTGLTPRVFHSALRIERAKALLEQTDLSLIEVGLEAGYESHGSFSFIFHKMVGLTPRDFRRLTRGEPVEAVTMMVQQSQRERLSPSHLKIEIAGTEPGRVLAIGLFGQAMPAGVPIDGCFVNGPTATLEFEWPANKQRLHVLAAAPDMTAKRRTIPGETSETLVARAEIFASDQAGVRQIKLTLRPIGRCDPPVLLPVQLMLMLESGRRTAA